MGVGIIGLNAEVAYVLHHVNLETIVLGIAKVVGHIVSIGSAAQLTVGSHEHLLNRILQILIKHTCQHLLGSRWKPLPTQVDIVDACALQVRVTLLLILLAHNLVRHNLVEARTVNRAIVRKTYIHILCRCPLERCRWQPVPIALLAYLSNVAELLQHSVYLVGMLGTQASVQFAPSALKSCHDVGSANVFLRVVVEL